GRADHVYFGDVNAQLGLIFEHGVGDGTFTFVAGSPTKMEGPYALGDLDGDGVPEIVSGSKNGGFIIERWTGSGLVETQVAGDYSVADALLLADVDGDGHLDVVLQLIADVTTVQLGDGHGGFGAATRYPFPVQYAADVDGDGHVDLVALTRTAPTWAPTGITVLINRGDGTFAPTDLPDLGSTYMAFGDLTGDGLPDMIAG